MDEVGKCPISRSDSADDIWTLQLQIFSPEGLMIPDSIWTEPSGTFRPENHTHSTKLLSDYLHSTLTAAEVINGHDY